MAKYTYKFTSVDTATITKPDTLTAKDDQLIDDFQVNSSFNQVTDFIELHYYSLDGRLLKSIPFYTNIGSPQDSETATDGTLNSISLGIEDDLLTGGYEFGDVYLSYNFLSDPFTATSAKSKFFVEEISPDRTEIRLLNTTLTADEIKNGTAKLQKLISDNTVSDFFVNLENNRLLLAINVDTLAYKDKTSVVVKLYNPLPEDINIKDTLSINIEVADTVALLAEAEIVEDEIKIPYLKGANFNVEVGQNTAQPSEYFNINDVFNYPVTNSYYQVRSIFEEKGAELSIDYSSYENFVNFSSAQERLENFKYRVDLINVYQSQSNARLESDYTEVGITGSKAYYEGLINNILTSFDHYDRFLYYESSSYSWPKTSSTRPYTLATGAATGSWYEEQLTSASIFDSTNPNQLVNTVPEFIREDPNNQKYATFLHMVGQHFDNLWIYTKALTEKYNADNRLNFGLSKDLIEDALKNFGVKLYSSNKSTQELFQMFTGETYNTGSESFVTEIISGSNNPVSEEDYRKQIYKRLYHNLPLLLKSKGTERGLRALLNTFGIPSLYSSDNHAGLNLIQLGGTVSGSFNLGEHQYATSSLSKIRIDNTGSIQDNTLSTYTSIVKRDAKYANDLNIIEAGFSPATYLNNYILASASAENFDIESVVGDPRIAYSSSYSGLISKAEEYLTPTSTSNYNLKDFTRLIKFYDNVLFKTIKDFVPARTNISTGIIIKPHLLERSKAKQVKPTFEQHNDFTASIVVGSRTGSHGDTFGGQDQYSAAYTDTRMTSGGLATYTYHSHEEAKYDGEFSGSRVVLSTGELNDENPFKYDNGNAVSYKYNFIDAGADCLVVWGEYTAAAPVSATPSVTPTPSNTPSNTPSTSPGVTPSNTPSVTPSTSGPNLQQWADFYIDSTGYSNNGDACNLASLGTHVFFTSSVGTSFSDLITEVQGGNPVTIYTDSSLTTEFTSTTIWHAADATGPGATYALLVNSSGDVGAVQSCSTVTPTPSTSPARIFLGLRNDGSNSPAVGWDTSNDACSSGVASIVPDNYVESADYQTPLSINTQIYNHPTNVTAFDGGDKYWLSEDQTYAYRIGANGLVSQAISCASPTPSITPTPSTTPSSVLTITLQAAGSELGTWPIYQVTVAIDGFKSFTRTLYQTDSSAVVDTQSMFPTGTVTGNGTITISRTAPDATVTDSTSLTISQINGHTTSPTSKTFTLGQTITNESFTLSGFDYGEDLTIYIAEG